MATRSLYDLLNGENASGDMSLAIGVTNPASVVQRRRFVADKTFFLTGGTTKDLYTWNFATNSSATVAHNHDGMFVQTGSTATNSNFTLDWENERPFDAKASVGVWCLKDYIHPDSTNWFNETGFGYTLGNTGHFYENHSGQTNYRLQTSQGESHTMHDSGVPRENRMIVIKLDNRESSCGMSLDGKLRVTATSGLQTSDRMQPTSYCNRGTTGGGSGAQMCSYRYCEAMNT